MGAAVEIAAAPIAAPLCPACRGRLRSVAPAHHVCTACDADHPPLGGVACLLSRRAWFVDQWQRRLGVLVTEGARTVAMFEAEARKPALLASTRTRLQAQAQIARDVLAELVAHLQPVVGPPAFDRGGAEPFIALDTLHFLHRDWGWSDSDENARALALLERVLPRQLGRVLVLGAGACRLTYDLHRRGTTHTCAVDIDPLVLTLARRVLAGESVVLTEGRANATELERLALTRTLALPHGAAPAPEIELVLADGRDPPFSDGSFDTVITPWFVDVVPDDLREMLPRIRRLLADGGHWIDFGPLLYPHQRPAATRFSREELFELAARAGLPVQQWYVDALPFAHSPLAERGRVESCLALRACAAAAAPAPEDEPPTWAIFPSLPVPRPTAEVPAGRAAASIAALVDGRASIDDIAAALAQRLPDTERAVIKDALRTALLAWHGLPMKGIEP